MTASVALRGVARRFGDVVALDGLDLEVGGGVFGLLGVNGAGKTTAMRILTGFLRPDAGEAFLCGRRVDPGDAASRERVGYMPQRPAFHGWMTAREALAWHGELAGMRVGEARRHAEELLGRLGLAEAAGRRVAGFSGGMVQRLGLAAALIGEPEILLLDEPAASLDPVGRAEVLDLVAALGRDRTVLLSSHILADVERVAEEVAILHRGRLVARERVADLRARELRPTWDVAPDAEDEGLEAAVRALPFVEEVRREGGGLRVVVSDEAACRRELPALLLSRGRGIARFSRVLPDLEAVFLRLVGRQS